MSKLKAIDTSEKDRALADLDRTRAELREIDLRQGDNMNNLSFRLFASISPPYPLPTTYSFPCLPGLYEQNWAEPKRDGSQFFGAELDFGHKVLEMDPVLIRQIRNSK